MVEPGQSDSSGSVRLRNPATYESFQTFFRIRQNVKEDRDLCQIPVIQVRCNEKRYYKTICATVHVSICASILLFGSHFFII